MNYVSSCPVEGIDVMESLPQKNVRRSDRSVACRITSPAIHSSKKQMRIYGDDVRLFYNDVSVDHLIQNAPATSDQHLAQQEA